MEYDYKQIEKFIKGELSEAELKKFKEELNTNAELKKEVMLYQDVEISLSEIFKYEKEDKTLKATFNEFGKKYALEYSTNKEETQVDNAGVLLETKVEEATNRPTITRRLFPLAALAAAAALLLFLFNPFTNQVSPTQLAEQNFTPYQLDAFMGDDNNTEIEWKNAVKYYRAEDYENALQNFNIFLQSNPNNKEALLAKGNAQLKLNQTNAAIQTFQQVGNNSEAAKWYLALAHLKNDEVKKAKPFLQSLTGKATYGKKAKALLKAIK